MFRTFRVRLLFWFLVFISASFIIILLSLGYQQKREGIFAKSDDIDQAYLTLLKSVRAQQNYFIYETKNGNYFLTGESSYLEQYQYWLDSTLRTLSRVDFSSEEKIQTTVTLQKPHIARADTLFNSLTEKIKTRGFKDYSLEGAMRDDAHWLEEVSEIPNEKILTLRRHEKDYIIRNEQQYVDKFSDAVSDLTLFVQRNQRMTQTRKKEVLSYLSSYQTRFLQLVQLDKEIGLKDNSGLKSLLDQEIEVLETGFNDLVSQSRQWAKSEFDNLTLYFGITVVLLVVISIVISAFIAYKITKPLTDLTTHITRFVASKFTLEKDHPIVQSKDEIGSLTKNFSILKNKVISQMKFFKQRVDERTRELAEANKKLEKISEANSRFVPQEFLQNLGRASIEEVALGDQVEREMTVVFTDIRGFTQISEELNPQENFDFLNEYLGGIVPIIVKHGGFIDKFIGDSVMALFPNAPDQAVKAVMEFDEFVKEFNNSIKEKHGMAPITIGTGIHTGSMILGTIGHDNRLETTVISDSVNTAARVEGLTRYYDTPLIITEGTRKRLEHPEEFNYRFLDRVKVKGKKETLSVYQLLAPAEELKISYIPKYTEAIVLVENGDYTGAISIFEELSERNPADKAVKRFIEKYKDLQSDASTDQGITHMTTK